MRTSLITRTRTSTSSDYSYRHIYVRDTTLATTIIDLPSRQSCNISDQRLVRTTRTYAYSHPTTAYFVSVGSKSTSLTASTGELVLVQ
eukprot:scaffold49990_cov23-Prasinocladus_malaysianus.AAC.1